MKLNYNFYLITFSKDSSWCFNNCIVFHPMKSNYLKFNISIITVELNGHMFKKNIFV